MIVYYIQEHINLVGFDDKDNPVVMSLKKESVANQEHTRVLLRMCDQTVHGQIQGTGTYILKNKLCHLVGMRKA